MTAPHWLIAERELRTYLATASFWAALAIGPVVAGSILLLGGTHPATPVAVQSADRQLSAAARVAVLDAAKLEGRTIRIENEGERLVLKKDGGGAWNAAFSSRFPLSGSGRALVARTLERDFARRAAARTPALTIRETTTGSTGTDAGAMARFALVSILWLTLTGSLGMLLQAVVRERANRALESLLAAATPWQIIVGKLAGVGCVSAVVLSVWLGSAVVAAGWLPRSSGAGAILGMLAAPAMLMRAAAIYLLAFCFYGAVTIALGAIARDGTAAQNLSRPMFVVLVVAFFISLACADGSGANWLVYVPPFTPFLMLLAAPGSIPVPVEALLLITLFAISAGVARFAAGRLSIARSSESIADRYRRLVDGARRDVQATF